MLCVFLSILIFTSCISHINCAEQTLLGIPTITFNVTSASKYSLTKLTSIVVDMRFADVVDNAGKTLIPPALHSFAETFASDLESTVGITLPVLTGDGTTTSNIVFLTLAKNGEKFLDAAGRNSSEGYVLTIADNGVTIIGASPLGVWWGTRTFIQQAKLGGNALPIGTGSDTPGWGQRGIMLDVARHYYPPKFLIELCSYLSFFKQNTFHLHLSDNLFNNEARYTTKQSLELYAAFRLNSDDPAVAGLVKPYRANETYTRDVFDDIQTQCAGRGVTIIPEIEAPGHALGITQWKPQLGLSDLSLLNITHPETIPTVKAIWKTFLPWFHSKAVHIGADEYDSTLADDYNFFVNSLSTFIFTESNHTIEEVRIWGTNEPGRTSSVNKDIAIQHWEFFEDNPCALIKEGYNVLNSDDGFYIVGKWSGSYPQQLDVSKIFQGNPAGGAFAPNVFDMKNASNNPARSNPNVTGHIAAQWNDYGPNATVYSEAYYSWRDGLPALADKRWGGQLSLQEYNTISEILHSAIPAQNLDKNISSKTATILQYDFTTRSNSNSILDTSGNNYHGTCHGCIIDLSKGVVSFAAGTNSSITTPLTSKGRNYTLSFRVNPSETSPIGASLFSSPDSSLKLGNGTVPNLMLVAGNQPYALNYTLPRDVWTDVSLVGRGNGTFLRVGGEPEEMEFLAILGVNGEGFRWREVGIEAPVARIGGDGFAGSISAVKLTNIAIA